MEPRTIDQIIKEMQENFDEYKKQGNPYSSVDRDFENTLRRLKRLGNLFEGGQENGKEDN